VTKKDGRVANITLAAQRIDGSVFIPGEDFNFNDVVGVRSEKAGFKPAPVLYAGRVIPGIGGGVCQVSSTLHASGLFAGLQVTTRRPHSRVSTYIEAGLDATVAFPPHGERIDLVLHNPHTFPLTLRAAVNGDKLTMHFISSEEILPPAYSKRIGHFGEHKRRWFRSWTRSSPDYRKRTQTHKPGKYVRSTLTYPDGVSIGWFSQYSPVDEMWEVGRKYDADAGVPWN